MLDPKLAEVSTINSFGRTEKVKVSDINACSEVEDYGTFKIEYPYEITIVDSEGEVILKEKTQSTLRAKDWNKKFYLKESANGNRYVAYSRYMSLLAIVTIMTKVKGELPEKLDLNKLVDFEFSSVIIDQESGDSFIDWVGTFELNGIAVPSESDLGAVAPKQEAKSGKGAW
jgi:hypothetical protein